MIKYPASYARMRGLKGKLLGKDQLEIFLGVSDVESITSVLSRSSYSEQLRGATGLAQVEHGLKQDLALSYMKILTFLRGRPARFVQALLDRFELLNVKSIVRMFARGSTEELSVEPLIFSLRRYHTIPVEDALKAEDLESLMELMKRTPFARALEIGYRQYEDEGEIFPLELALDLDYYDRLWKAMDALGPLDKHNTARLLGIRYDITNIIWMLRFKEYRGFSPEQLLQYIIPHGWGIRGNEFWRAAADSDVTDAIIALQINPYDDLFKSVSRVDGSFIMGAEIHLLRYLYRESLEIFMRFPLQSAQLVAFFICKEMEIRDIITVLAGRNLELSQERIRPYMVTV